MLTYKNQSLQFYLDQLASRNPVPGGGSAAALVGALGAALIAMVANYSVGKGKTKKAQAKIKDVLRKSEKFRQQLLALVDRDAQAYLKVVQTRKAAPNIKHKARQKARAVPLETCRLCYDVLQLAPNLVEHGNPYLLSDVKVAVEMLWAGFNAAMFNAEANQ